MENQSSSNVNVNVHVLTHQKLTPQSHSTPKHHTDRKRLQTLQQAANGKGGLNGGKQTPLLEPKIRTTESSDSIHSSFVISQHGVKIFRDPDISSLHAGIHCTRGTQTTGSLLEDVMHQRLSQEVEGAEDSGVQSASESKEVFDLLISEKPSENYWKGLAEERRRALQETLEENERLVGEVEHLKKDNARLTEIEQKAEALQKLLEDIIPDEEDDDTNEGFTVSHSTDPSLSDDADALDTPDDKKLGGVKMADD